MLMPKPSNVYPKRGEIFIADLDPAFGREMHKKRPALVVSSNDLNKIFPTIIIIPFSSIIPDFVGQDVVKLPKQSGIEKDSLIVVHQIRAIDKSRLVKRIGKLSSKKLKEVEETLKLVLGMIALDG